MSGFEVILLIMVVGLAAYVVSIKHKHEVAMRLLALGADQALDDVRKETIAALEYLDTEIRKDFLQNIKLEPIE